MALTRGVSPRVLSHVLIIGIATAAILSGRLIQPASVGIPDTSEAKRGAATVGITVPVVNAAIIPAAAVTAASASRSEHLPAPQEMSDLLPDSAASAPIQLKADVWSHALSLEASLDQVPTPAPTEAGADAPAPSETVTPSPTPTPTSEDANSRGGEKSPQLQSYTVQHGDTLLGIAASFGITPETVLWANDLGNGQLLHIGQQLTIPPVSGVLHTVQKGDTLSSIADSYGADVAKIVEANHLAGSGQIQEGEVLIVPGGIPRTVAVADGPPSAPSPRETAAATKYTVVSGDSLASIADAFHVKPSAIQAANGLLDPDKLRIGEVLVIPNGKQQGPAASTQVAPTPKPSPTAVPAVPTPAPRLASPTPRPPAPPTPRPAASPSTQAAASAVSGASGDRVAAIALKYLGYRYIWGGSSPLGFDCSGFTWYVYKQAGISIPNHDPAGQLNSGRKISRDALLPGDLVFFQNTYEPGLSHVGIYLGGGRFINAESESAGVQVRALSDPYWASRYVGASRPR